MPAFPTSERSYTLEEFERFRDAAPPGPRYEYLDGEILVSPSPSLVASGRTDAVLSIDLITLFAEAKR